jgi:hypothetical protein
MEKGMTGIDFVNADTMIQVHDYHGVSLFGSRTANSKQATKEVIKVMQDNYPEVLVSLHPRQGFRMGFRWLHSQSL